MRLKRYLVENKNQVLKSIRIGLQQACGIIYACNVEQEDFSTQERALKGVDMDKKIALKRGEGPAGNVVDVKGCHRDEEDE